MPPVVHNKFVNPATEDEYVWPRNHEAEEPFGKTINITATAPSGNVGLIRQQGDDGPLVLRLSGKIFHRAQFVAFWAWYNLSKTQTIYFEDFDGQSYEVQITSFLPQRQRKLSYTGPDAGVPYHFWNYTMEMHVYAILDGDMEDVTP